MPNPYTNQQTPDFFKDLHPTDYRYLGNQVAPMSAGMMETWKGFENEFRATPKFDAQGVKGNIDDSYFRSISLLPSVRNNLKGMGVGAAEGTMALNQSLPLIQSRGEAYGNLERDKYQADQSWLSNLGNIMMKGNELGMSQQQIIMQVMQMIQNQEING